MSFQYLSEEQKARYRRFLTDPSPEDLERFFYLDADALAEVAKKRGPHNRLGWGLQHGPAILAISEPDAHLDAGANLGEIAPLIRDFLGRASRTQRPRDGPRSGLPHRRALRSRSWPQPQSSCVSDQDYGS
ncbi:DUF4158 domain-containing protein [Nonomuraea sp. NPDC049684]|uniref:DUF4158 domain-containing protein n=1 Tax=Nonomuraea sp. NPDC049684 TaxID=3364356 RepID=UPI00379C7847